MTSEEVSRPAPAERIDTDRLVLRLWEVSDASEVNAVVNESRDSHLLPWLPRVAMSHRSMEESRNFCGVARERWRDRLSFWFAIVERADGGLLGGIGIEPRDWPRRHFEIGYWLGRASEGRGYMREAVRALTATAFDALSAARVEIRCDEGNLRSQRVAERCGYRYETRLPRSADDSQRPVLGDTLVYLRSAADSPGAILSAESSAQ